MQVGSNAIPGIGNGLATDGQFATITGSGIKRSGSLITLDYDEILYQQQPYATRVENVTSFAVVFFSGNITLEPDTCLLYTSPSPRDRTRSRMPSSA